MINASRAGCETNASEANILAKIPGADLSKIQANILPPFPLEGRRIAYGDFGVALGIESVFMVASHLCNVILLQ
jgi:hypothetical protein